MNASAPAVLVGTGSVIFLTGAAVGVPRVFREPDHAQRLRILEEGIRRWRLAQPLYAIGPLVVGAGVGTLAVTVDDGSGWVWLAASSLLLLAGALCWSWSVYLRGRYVRQFALGGLPGWPFATYVWLTLAGLAALGAGELAAGLPAWSGWLTLVGCLGFLVVYVRFRDIPPFVFYLLLPVVSLSWS